MTEPSGPEPASPAAEAEAAKAAAPEPAATESKKRFPIRYYFVVHIPIAVAAIFLPIGRAAGWSWLATIGLCVAAYVVIVGIGWTAGTALANSGNREQAAINKVTGPVVCDRCHAENPTVCPRPHLGTCPLRSKETGKTYKDYL